MRNKEAGFVIGFLLIAFLGSMLSCATDTALLQNENSLPQNPISYYNDPFDKMREDLWDRAGIIWQEEQLQNFKQADLRFDNGKLIIQTKTGSFSKGGLGSRYVLRGDFDIQLNLQTHFLKDISGMDQVFTFAVYEIGNKTAAIIGLSKKSGFYPGVIFTNCFVNGKKQKKGISFLMENFKGAFRILRTGKTVSMLYKKTGIDQWTQVNTFGVSVNDMMIGFQLRNFFSKRTRIQAQHSVSVELESLIINAARQIIEDEI